MSLTGVAIEANPMPTFSRAPTGPGSVRYRRLFGCSSPTSWPIAELVAACVPSIINGIYADTAGHTYRVVQVDTTIQITPCSPTGTWMAASGRFSRSSGRAMFNFMAPLLIPGLQISGCALGQFVCAQGGSDVLLQFITNTTDVATSTVYATWTRTPAALNSC